MSFNNKSFTYKIASEPWEFDAIHKLNYQTFVKEIPQHSTNKEKFLIDKFHSQNTYVICIKNDILLGMLAIRDSRPFSLDNKISNLNTYLPPSSKPVEIRLLAIKRNSRNTIVFSGLLKKVFKIALGKGYDLGLVSGTTRQIRLYKHIGFKAFGALVGNEHALYQPMYITLDKALGFKQRSRVFNEALNSDAKAQPLNYLPGPVSVDKRVLKAHAAVPISHRSSHFKSDFLYLKSRLEKLVNADRVFVLSGSGTLANDIIAAQLSCLGGHGLILVNGEFGRRLEDQAFRANLGYDTLQTTPGSTFNTIDIEEKINAMPICSWLWVVHCETSTGVLNDISSISALCQQKSIALCLDCISTIGCYPLNLKHVFLASGTSGKGLASIPGLALVFANKAASTNQHKLPRYFDLGYYDTNNGIPFTISSNAIYALLAALNSDKEQKVSESRAWSKEACTTFESMGLCILAQPNCRAYHVITLALPENNSSKELGEEMEKFGYLISYQSGYLLQNNWIQLCFMGHAVALEKSFYQQLNALLQR